MVVFFGSDDLLVGWQQVYGVINGVGGVGQVDCYDYCLDCWMGDLVVFLGWFEVVVFMC